MKTNEKIKEVYGVSEEDAARLFFEVGLAFAQRNYPDLRIEKKKRFWAVFAKVWEADDRAIQHSPDLFEVPYCELKNAMVDDLVAFGVFYEEYNRAAAARAASATGDSSCFVADQKKNEADKWRKRVMAAVGGWLALSGKDSSAALIKGIACQAARCGDFNAIPVSQLRNLYNSFLRQQDELKNVKQTIKNT